MTYTLTCEREGRWWVVAIDGPNGLVGTTQARTLDAAPAMAAEVIELMTEDAVPAESLTYTVKLPNQIAQQLRASHQAAARAAVAQNEAATAARALVSDLTCQEFTHGDIASILGVSRQRVGQLVHQ